MTAALLGAALLLPSASAKVAAPIAALTRMTPPQDGRAYFGFTYLLFDSTDPVWGDDRPFSERIGDSIAIELSGKTPAFIKVWAPWQHPDLEGKPMVGFDNALSDIAKVMNVVGDRGVLHLDWNITLSNGANEGLTVRDIAHGRADSYIRSYAKSVREYGKPILMTLFNGEFNGSWWWAVSPLANRLLTTDDFVRAWRRVVDIYRAVGARNVSWAWVVNGYPADPSLQPGIDPNIGAYYPGDGYVDWVGVDVYDVGTPSWMDGPYAFAVSHGKPVFIGEFGIRHEWSGLTPPQWRMWLSAIFDYFESHPAIKAISYFNLNNRRGATHVKWDPARDVFDYGGHVRYAPNVNDHDHRLVAGGPEIRALFAGRIASERYISAVSTESVDAPILVPTVEVLRPTLRGRTATVRWKGNLAAHTFDVAVKPRAATWRTVANGLMRSTYKLTASAGARVLVRVRPHDVYGSAGPWSRPQAIAYPG